MAEARAQEVSQPRMRRVAFASLTGTTIEFYDFFIYGTAAALVFGPLFFPALGQAQGTVAAFATFGVAFVARPFGSIIFGHFGDRIGRKKTLVSTLLMMGLATVAIGLLPTGETVGVLAPILLVVLRILQGLAVGGEWAGATLLTAEYAPPKKRGLYALFPQLGPSLAFILASATFLTTALTMSDEAFLSWGWRIPFVASILLVAIGLYVRLKIDETPVYRNQQASRKPAEGPGRLPFLDAVTRQPREVLLGGGALVLLFAFFYIGVTYLTSYGTTELGLERTTVLAMGIVGGFAFAITTILAAIWSDRIGRRNMVLIGNAVAVLWAPALFPVLDIGTPWAFGLGLSVTLGVVGIAYGPAGAYLPELFSTRYRYTGAGMAYNLAGVVGGGLTPLLAAALVAAFGSTAIGWYLAGAALLSLVCVLGLRETKASDLNEPERAGTAAGTS